MNPGRRLRIAFFQNWSILGCSLAEGLMNVATDDLLLVGSDEGWLLGLPATSKDHDRDAAQERRAGRYWVDIGSGKWDAMGRPSEVRADRIIRVHPDRVRRAAGRVDSRTFEQVAAAVARHWDD